MRAYLFSILVSSLDVQTSTTTAFTTIPNQQTIQTLHTKLNARDDNEDDFVYAGKRRSGRREMEEGGGFDRQSTSSSRYQDNVEFFDLDDDDELFDDEFDSKLDEIDTYNGIIPNPLLDAMGELYFIYIQISHVIMCICCNLSNI